jgi:hypothetical protein
MKTYRINTKNLKTAWKRSESKLTFREWCRQHGSGYVWNLAGKLKEKYGKDWLEMEKQRETYRVVTNKAGKLTDCS